ncbi:hypothetical protein ACFL6S_27865 [Candidatus Poribacteria bacterium]
MRNIAMKIVLLFIFLSAICSAHAYVYYVEAEDHDLESELNVAGCIWTLVEDENVSNEKYMKYQGPHVGANTSLFYTLPDIDDNPAQCKVWSQCLMPDGGANSYFVYVSTDGGAQWGPQQTVSSAEGPDWKWVDFTPTTPFEKGEGNVLRFSEREDANLDLICVRNDGAPPSEEEYVVWLEEWEAKKLAVEPSHKIATTWGNIRSAY